MCGSTNVNNDTVLTVPPLRVVVRSETGKEAQSRKREISSSTQKGCKKGNYESLLISLFASLFLQCGNSLLDQNSEEI